MVLLLHGVLFGCLAVFVLLSCFMSCLLLVLFDVLYELYSGGVRAFSDVPSCLVF